MAFNPNATLAANDADWQRVIAGLNAQADANEAELDVIEAAIEALEAGGGEGSYLLDAPVPSSPPSVSGVSYTYVDSTGQDHFVEASYPAGAIAARLYVGGDADGNRYRLRTNDNRHFYLSVQTAAQAATDGDSDAKDLSGFIYRTLPAGADLTADDPIIMRLSFIKRVVSASYNGAELFSLEVDKLNLATAGANSTPVTLPATGGQYAGAAQRASQSNAALKIKKVDVVGGNPPLSLSDVRLVAGFRFQVTATYTGTSVSYLGQLESASGAVIVPAQPVDVIENTVAGIATIQSRDGIPIAFAGQPVTFRLIEQRSGVASGISAAATQTRGAGLALTTNLAQDSDGYQHTGRSNRISPNWRSNNSGGNRTLRGWGDANPELNKRGEPTAEAIQAIMAFNASSAGDGSGKGPVAMIRAPYTPGERTRVQWVGKVADCEFIDINGNIQNRVLGSSGDISYIDFNHKLNPLALLTAGTHDGAGVWFRIAKPSGTYPSSFEAFPIDSNGNRLQTGFWDDRYVAFLKRLVGVQPGMTVPLLPVAMRPMDLLSTIGYNTIPLSASDIAYRGQKGSRGGYSFEDILDLYELVGVGGWINVALQADESYVRTMAAKCARWCAEKMLFLLFEGAGNEGWNDQQSAWGTMAGMYEAEYPGKESNQNARALKMQGIISTRQMKWIKSEFDKVPGATKYLLRGINFQNANIANARNVVATADPDFMDNHEVFMTAPYTANGLAADLPKTYPASDDTLRTFVERVKGVVPTIYGNAKKFVDWAAETKKIYIPYEGFFENTGNEQVISTLKQSPIGAEITKYKVEYWRDNVGGPFGLYYDLTTAWGSISNMCHTPELATSEVPSAHILLELRRQVDAAVASARAAS